MYAQTCVVDKEWKTTISRQTVCTCSLEFFCKITIVVDHHCEDRMSLLVHGLSGNTLTYLVCAIALALKDQIPESKTLVVDNMPDTVEHISIFVRVSSFTQCFQDALPAKLSNLKNVQNSLQARILTRPRFFTQNKIDIRLKIRHLNKLFWTCTYLDFLTL